MVACKACGNDMPEGALFCSRCGTPAGSGADSAQEQPTVKVVKEAAAVPPPTSAPVPPPTSAPAPPPITAARAPQAPPPPTSGYPPYGPPGMYGRPPVPPRRSRLGMWIGIAVAAVIVIAAAITIPLLLLDREDDTASTGTTRQPTTTTATTAPASSTTSSSTTSSTTTSSSTTTTTAPPGDSAGQWVEAVVPEIPHGTFNTKVSDEALLMEANSDAGFKLYAYMFDSGELVRLPTGGNAFLDADLDGSLAVWREAEYDYDTGEYRNGHLYAYTLPGGPKVEVAAGTGSFSYPQVAGSWVTWVEGAPWETDPDMYSLEHIYGVRIEPDGEPLEQPVELVSAATADALGDSYWTYSLSATHLAWEVVTPVDIFDAGTYVMDLESRQPLKISDESWLPSLGGDTLVYWIWEEGLKASDLQTGRERTVDPLGDYASAGPTFTAYYRTIESAETWSYEVVTRGHETGWEQVLLETDVDPYFMPPIAVSAHRVALLLDDVVRLFTWESG